MSSDLLYSGQLQSTKRSLLQDAEAAMRTDILRGIVELVTNADDAYIRAGAKKGTIIVEVEHTRKKPWKLCVRDRATGMSDRDMKQKLAHLGVRGSGFEAGIAVRGNRGRGLKDLIAFGPVRVESIRNSQYAEMTIDQSGVCSIAKARAATATDRERLGVNQNGTVVTVTVQPNIQCPLHEKLAERLALHYEMRYIMADPARKVVLRNVNTHTDQVLRFDIDYERLDQLCDRVLDIRGYADATVHLRVWRLQEKDTRRAGDPCRLAGILLRGVRTVYESTFFDIDPDPSMGWLTGIADCPALDRVIREYDDLRDSGQPIPGDNPQALVARTREGLEHNHPFYQAIRDACQPVVRDLIAQEARHHQTDADRATTQETRNLLSKLASITGRFLHDELRLLDLDDESGERTTGADEQPALQIIPPVKTIDLGDEAVLSVVADPSKLGAARDVGITVDPDGVVEVLDGSPFRLGPHRMRKDLLACPLKFRALAEGEVLIGATVGDRQETAIITVVPPRNEHAKPAVPPDVFAFERPLYRVSWQRRKNLRILMPSALSIAASGTVSVTSDSDAVAIRDGGRTDLQPAPSGDWLEAEITVEGRTLGGDARITAATGSLQCSCRVVVRQPEPKIPPLKVELTHEKPPVFRAEFATEPDLRRLRVYVRHPSLLPLLGDDLAGQSSPAFQAVLVEVIAEASVRWLLERKYQASAQGVDATELYYSMFEYETRLVPRLRKALADMPLRHEPVSEPVSKRTRNARPAIAAPEQLTLKLF